MIRKTIAVLGITLLCMTTVAFTADNETTEEQIADLQEEVKDLEKRVMKTERKAGIDRIRKRSKISKRE
jgi:cell division protein FtsB